MKWFSIVLLANIFGVLLHAENKELGLKYNIPDISYPEVIFKKNVLSKSSLITPTETFTANTELYGIPIYGEELPFSEYVLPPLSDEDFNDINKSKQYKVALKLYNTLFYGVNEKALKKVVDSGMFISKTRALFNRVNKPSELSAVENKLSYYYYDSTNNITTMARTLARLYHLKPGKSYFNRWAAYILTQSIFFSPAYELNTVHVVDALNIYAYLVRSFDSGYSMQWTAYNHMISNENWRRFRSPEDNGREMLEIYLRDMNDSHVPLAGRALQNWTLDRTSNTLLITLNENIKPIRDLFKNKKVTTGTDFYSTLSMQPSFIVTACRRLVDIYFSSSSVETKRSITHSLVKSHPETWTGILRQIVFSKAYLLTSNKTKSMEETFFSTAKALKWEPKAASFYYIARNLQRAHQSIMYYKLGRKTVIPLDSQSFAWYHKTIRENILVNRELNTSLDSTDDGWQLKKLFYRLPPNLIRNNEFDDNGKRTIHWYENENKRATYIVNSLFLRLLGRRAKPRENNFLISLIDNLKYDEDLFNNFRVLDMYGNKDGVDADRIDRGIFSILVLDYISRLSELYVFDSIK